MLHWLSMLACSSASICLMASARDADLSPSTGVELVGQTITIAGAVGLPSLPPLPAAKPKIKKPLFEISRPSRANSAQENLRYSLR